MKKNQKKPTKKKARAPKKPVHHELKFDGPLHAAPKPKPTAETTVAITGVHRVLIGHVAVDSGQLVLCDPTYIDTEWNDTHTLDVTRRFRDKAGRVWGCAIHNPTGAGCTHLFDHYDQHLVTDAPTMRTPNQLIGQGEWTEVFRTPSGVFSYQGCCDATLSPKKSGELRFRAGHPGVGIAFSTDVGDGMFPVYATYVDGKLNRVEVQLQ